MSAAAFVLSSAQPKEMGRPVRLAPITFSGPPAIGGQIPLQAPPGPGGPLSRRRAKVVEISTRTTPGQRQYVTPALMIAGVVFGAAVLGYVIVGLMLLQAVLRTFLPVSG